MNINLRKDASELKRLGITTEDIVKEIDYRRIPIQELSYFGKKGYGSNDSSLENMQSILTKYENSDLHILLAIFSEEIEENYNYGPER